MSNFDYNAINTQQYGIPSANRSDFTYVAAGAANDDLVATITYYNQSGNVLGVLTFTYINSTNNIAKVERTA